MLLLLWFLNAKPWVRHLAQQLGFCLGRPRPCLCELFGSGFLLMSTWEAAGLALVAECCQPPGRPGLSAGRLTAAWLSTGHWGYLGSEAGNEISAS